MKAILVLMLIVLLGGLIALTTGCTELNMGTQVLFEGPLMVQSKSSDIFAIYYTRVKDCMGVSKPLPLPDVKIMDSNGVMCGDNVGFGCYHNALSPSQGRKGTIIIPIETNPTVIKHEFIHHILFLTTGNMDLNHNTEWFIKCGGLGEQVQRPRKDTLSQNPLPN
jgi:hypothetical protein